MTRKTRKIQILQRCLSKHKNKWAFLGVNLSLFTPLALQPLTINAVEADSSLMTGEMTITPSTANWTNGNVDLSISGKNISEILTPDGTYVSNSNMTYTATQNGEYTFIGFNNDNEVEVIMTYVVSNIDRSGKDGEIVPGDSNWRNKDVEVSIDIKEDSNT